MNTDVHARDNETFRAKQLGPASLFRGASREGVEIEGAETAAISFPGFYDLLESVTRR